jgi:hypothetical protein
MEFSKYTVHKMYFSFLHGEYMVKWKEHLVRSVQMFIIGSSFFFFFPQLTVYN